MAIRAAGGFPMENPANAGALACQGRWLSLVDNPPPFGRAGLQKPASWYRRGPRLAAQKRMTMRITLVGSRHFGVATLNMLKAHGVEVARVVVHDAEDRLAATARADGIEVVVQADPKLVVA